MRRVWLIGAVVAVCGCYHAPYVSPAERQAAAMRAYQQQQQAAADAAQDAETARICAAATDPQVLVSCSTWRETRRQVEADRQQMAYDSALRQQEAEQRRRERLGDALQAGAATYQRVYNQTRPLSCTSTVVAGQIRTTCD